MSFWGGRERGEGLWEVLSLCLEPWGVEIRFVGGGWVWVVMESKTDDNLVRIWM